MAADARSSAQPRRRPALSAHAPRCTGAATRLATIARLAMTPPGRVSVATLTEACAHVRDVLGAEEAYVVQSGDPHFVRVDAPGDPTAYELTQKGYFLVWRELATDRRLAGGLFDTVERRIVGACPLAAGVPATHLTLLLPSDESASELLIVRGPWPAGLSDEQVAFASAVQPMLTHLVGALVDTQRRDRQREQLRSLSAVAAVLTRGQDQATALAAVATALAQASGFDWAVLTLFDEALERVTARALNQARHSETETAAVSRESDAGRQLALGSARHIAQTGRPLLYPRLDDAGRERPLDRAVQRYMERAHVLSTATFPLYSGERLLGTINFSASSAHGFDPAEVEFMTLLCEQAALAIEWLELHRELREANAALARAATHDALTGLPNRALFLDRLAQAIARAQRGGGTVAVYFIDLDDFKAVNDRLGHAAGDRLLQVVAQRLQGVLRAEDTAARLGGDEFTAVVESLDDEAAIELAERLRMAVQLPLEIAGVQLTPRASVGVACGVADAAGAVGLLRQADLAMYQAKLRGKAEHACCGGDTSPHRLQCGQQMG